MSKKDASFEIFNRRGAVGGGVTTLHEGVLDEDANPSQGIAAPADHQPRRHALPALLA